MRSRFSYYASPLAWMFVPILLGAIGMIITTTHWYGHSSGRFAAAGFWILSGLSALLLLGLWWLRTVLLLRRTTGCRSRRVVDLAVFLPVAWVLLVVIGAIFRWRPLSCRWLCSAFGSARIAGASQRGGGSRRAKKSRAHRRTSGRGNERHVPRHKRSNESGNDPS